MILVFSSGLTSVCITDSRSIHVSTDDAASFFFMAQSCFIVYISATYSSFISRWTFRLLPHNGYCKSCCCERYMSCVFLNYNGLNSGRWWPTGRPGVPRFMGSQRVGHDCATELNWSIFICVYLKNWYFQTVVLEKALESPLNCNEVKPVNPKGNQPSIYAGRAEAEAPIFWPLDTKSQLIGKNPDSLEKTLMLGKI